MTRADPALTTTHPGKHRVWRVQPRTGTGPEDRYTLLGNPIPSDANPAASIEDGQFSSWRHAIEAAAEADSIDDGTHLEGLG